MKRSTRLLVLLIGLEVALAGLGAWLIYGLTSGALHPATSVAESTQTLLSGLGGAMGTLAGIVGTVAILMRRKGL